MLGVARGQHPELPRRIGSTSGWRSSAPAALRPRESENSYPDGSPTLSAHQQPQRGPVRALQRLPRQPADERARLGPRQAPAPDATPRSWCAILNWISRTECERHTPTRTRRERCRKRRTVTCDRFVISAFCVADSSRFHRKDSDGRIFVIGSCSSRRDDESGIGIVLVGADVLLWSV